MSTPQPPSAPPRPPVLVVTRYDLVTAFLIALVLSLIVAVAWLVGIWYANRPPQPVEDVPLELVEIPGGEEDGAIGETLRLDSPEPVRDDPAAVDAPTDEALIEKTLETVLELSDEASELARQQFEEDARHAGRAGRATGTGRRALGRGPGQSGVPREQRWFVAFSDYITVETYARQLDFFGIELGALFPDGRLVYLSNPSAPAPTMRSVRSGEGEQRLYFTWQGGGRRVADLELFRRAGVDASGATLFHFYPPQAEAALARLEREYRNAPVDSIRRTYFAVQPVAGGYQFAVTRQIGFR